MLKIASFLFILLLGACGIPGGHQRAESRITNKYATAAPFVARRRAALDLRCGEEAMIVVSAGRGNWDVAGCGRKATYAVNCAADMDTGEILEDGCSALLTGPVQAAK